MEDAEEGKPVSFSTADGKAVEFTAKRVGGSATAKRAPKKQKKVVLKSFSKIVL